MSQHKTRRTVARTTARRSTPATAAPSSRLSETPPLTWMPTRVFFTSGTAVHTTQRGAMQRAMNDAGVGECNLVKTSSVIPPGCEIITRERGLRLLRAGNIVHAVIAQGQTSEPHQRVTPALCWAQPEDSELPGYIAEVEEDLTMGKNPKTATDEAGEALLTIMAEKAAARVDARKLWAERGRDRHVRVGRVELRVGSMAVSAIGPESQNGTQQYAVAAVLAVFL